MFQRIVVAVLLTVVLAGVVVNEKPAPTDAASNFRFISFDGDEVVYEFTGTTDDGGGNDRVMVVFYGANGIITDTDSSSVAVGSTVIVDDSCSPGSGFPSDPEPCTFEIYDVTASPGTNDPGSLPEIFASPRLYPPVAAAQPKAQVATISISVAQAQPVYESPRGNVVRDASGSELWLPNDFDGSGSDTHLVMSSAEIDGRTWYEIWIGASGSTVWVPADKVTAVE